MVNSFSFNLKAPLEKRELNSVSRAISEMLEALSLFSHYRKVPKVAIFGSARTAPESPTYQLAKKFGKLMQEAGYFVITGAGPGIMEAGHAGAGRNHSFGLNITLPFEQQSNPIIHGDDKDFHFKYFFVRKLMFVKESKAVVVFPGGFGTMDELYETLTLMQNGKSPIVPVILISNQQDSFWQDWDDFVSNYYLKKNLISPYDRNLYSIHTDVQTARMEILNFYKVFDSYCYWKENKLIIRIKKRLAETIIKDLAIYFNQLTPGGTVHAIYQKPFFDQGVDLYEHCFYLGVEFNHKDFGALRLLIDKINQVVPG